MTTTHAEIQETRSVIYVNGVQTFRIVVQCIDKGPMPDAHLFVLEIFDPQDPQQDVFVRIADIADLDSENTDPDEPGYKPNRALALGAGDTYWRADTFTKDYTDIEVATAAVAAITDRINTLVTDFSTFDDSFQTPSTVTAYPSSDPTTVETMKAAYDTAYAAYETAQTALVTTQTALTTSETNLASAETVYNEWSSFLTEATEIADNLTTVSADYGLFVGTYAKTFIADVDRFIENYLDYFPDYQSTVIELQFNATGWSEFLSTDVGREVNDSAAGGGSQGTLIAYDNDAKTILVVPFAPTDENLFPGATAVALVGRSGYWNRDTGSVVVVAAGGGPSIQALIAARERFAQTRLDNVITVSLADTTSTLAGTHKSNVSSKVNEKTGEVTTAQSGVTTAQISVNEAQADLQTAYNDLEAAYTNVKIICPNWSPVSTFPPLL